jgi:putative adenylate-forming enzyme
MRPDLILLAYLRTRRALWLSAAQLAGVRARSWRRLQPFLARTPALARHAGRPLAQFPVTDIDELRADYGAWNSLGLSDAQLRAIADAAEAGATGGGLSAGWSSGTGGGPRGLFLAGAAERADYVGQSLARLLPVRALFGRQRLALHLRASNSLYSDVRRRRFDFRHFPLEASPAETIAALEAFDPTILIAPPHRLIEFARNGARLPRLRHLFCGSEPISSAERVFVSKRLGLRPRQIYQATEGFLGAECDQGRLHLNADALEIELEAVAGTDGFRPVITDLRRTSQPIVRVRGDDFLELDPGPCPCGNAGRVICAPQGRVGDLWRLSDRIVTPAQVVGAVEFVLGGAVRWQAAASPHGAILHVSPRCPPPLADQAAVAVAALTGAPARPQHDLAPWQGPKRRKVVWNDG